MTKKIRIGVLAVTAYKTYIVSTSSRLYNGVVLCLPAPSTALRKGGLVFTSGRWSTKTGRGCTRYVCQKAGFDGNRTNQSLWMTAAARIFDETLTNNRSRLENANAPKLQKKVSSTVQGQNKSDGNITLAGFDNERNIAYLILCRKQ